MNHCNDPKPSEDIRKTNHLSRKIYDEEQKGFSVKVERIIAAVPKHQTDRRLRRNFAHSKPIRLVSVSTNHIYLTIIRPNPGERLARNGVVE